MNLGSAETFDEEEKQTRNKVMRGDTHNRTVPMILKKDRNVYEIELNQKDSSMWEQTLLLLAKQDYRSAHYNAERIHDKKKSDIEDRRKSDMTHYTVRDVYDIVQSALFLAKCKLMTGETNAVDELLEECSLKLKEIKDQVVEIK